MIYTIAATEWELKPFIQWWEEHERPMVLDVRRRPPATSALAPPVIAEQLQNFYARAPHLYPVDDANAVPVRLKPANFEKGVADVRTFSKVALLTVGGLFPRSYRRFLGERLALHTERPVAHVRRFYDTARQIYLVVHDTHTITASDADVFTAFDWLLTPDWKSLIRALEGEDTELALSGFALPPDEPFLQALLRYSPLEPALQEGYRRLARESVLTRLFDTRHFEESARPSLLHAIERIQQTAQSMPVSYARALLESVVTVLSGHAEKP